MNHAKQMLAAGEMVVLSVEVAKKPIEVWQRKFFHGPVLTQISEQVSVNNQKWVPKAWKEYYRQMFLPDTWVMMQLPGQKKATPRRVRHSTEELGPKGYSEYTERVIAHASTEFGVEFHFDPDERESARYVAPARKPKRLTEEPHV
jgi:hypothetical protein